MICSLEGDASIRFSKLFITRSATFSISMRGTLLKDSMLKTRVLVFCMFHDSVTQL